MTKSGSSRGFSLFTPLVGTALVIMAIIIAAGMVQNDVRISRTLTSSYEVSSQSMAAKLIKASAELHMISKIEQVLYETLSDEDRFDFECSTATECTNMATSIFTKTNYAFMVTLTTGAGSLYGGIIDSVNLASEYRTDVDENDFSECLMNLFNADKSTVLVEFVDGFMVVTINADDIEEYCGDVFELPFRDDLGNNIVVSVIPEGFSYTTSEPIKQMIDETASAFGDMDSEDLDFSSELADYFPDSDDSCYDDSNDKKAVVSWLLDNGDTFKLVFYTGKC